MGDILAIGFARMLCLTICCLLTIVVTATSSDPYVPGKYVHGIYMMKEEAKVKCINILNLAV